VFPYSRRSGTVAYNLKQVYKDYVLKERTDKLLQMDKELRQEYFNKFIGTTRKAVSLRNNQALTDNYLTIKNVPKHNSIFDVVVK
jgi:tRNA A37 methylthiotransferase MiaB